MKKDIVLRQLFQKIRKNISNQYPESIEASRQCPYQLTFQNSTSVKNAQISSEINTGPLKKNTEKEKDKFLSAKPYSEVPKPKGFPFIGTVLHYIWNGGGKYLHEYVLNRHRQLGPIYKEKYSTEPFEVLFIGDIEGTRDVYKNEGKTPLSFVIGGEQLYIKLRGMKRGLLFNQGEEWLQLRRPMNQLLLKRNDYYDRFDLTSQLIEEYLQKWSESANENGGRVFDFEKKINEIGIDSFGAFAFGDRFQTHRQVIEKDGNGFYQMTKDYWEANMVMQLIPPILAHKFKLPVWSRFETAISNMLAIGRKWTELAKEDIASNMDGHGFLHLMLKEYDTPEGSIVCRIFSDFVAALESETTMIQWIIYVMGRNPIAQDKVLEELQAVGKLDESLTWRQVDGMPYLTACIKESLRMYPSNCFTVRILPEESLVKGYRIPAGTIAAVALMSSQRDPSIFPNPDRFWPERWFRSDVVSSLGSESGAIVGKYLGVNGCQPYLPFAWGSARGCIFRKISTKRMTLFLANLVKTYSFTTKEVKPVMRSLMIPDKDMNLNITKRNLISDKH